MLYKITKRGSRFAIVNKETGSVVLYSSSIKKAMASMKARLVGSHGWKPPKKRGK